MTDEVTHADIIRRLERIEERMEVEDKKLAPVFESYKDVAALGRSGRLVGRTILWIGGLVGAVMVVLEFMSRGH
jgi:hypothetical protein